MKNYYSLPLHRLLAVSAAAALVSLTATLPAQAQNPLVEGSIYYYVDTATISTDILGNDVVIGKAPGGTFANGQGDTDILTPYTVTVANGARISENNNGADGYRSMNVFNAATLDITGGAVGIAWGHGNSLVNVKGGTVDDATSSDNSTVHISGGAVRVSYANFANSKVNISGGAVETVYNLGGTVNLTGGSVGTAIGFYDFPSSRFNMSGGTVDNLLSANGTVAVTAGVVNVAQASNVTAFSISGGTVHSAQSFDTATLNVSGGSIGAFNIAGSSTLSLVGNGFSVTASEAHWGFEGNTGLGYVRDYTITGTLGDGTAFNKTITAAAAEAVVTAENVQLRGLGIERAPDLFVTEDSTINDFNSFVYIGVDPDFNPFTTNVQIGEGASLGGVEIYSASIATMTGGIIHGYTYIDIGSTLNVEGGTLSLVNNYGGMFTMTEGTLTTLYAGDGSASDIRGGAVGEILNSNGAVDIRGGLIGPNTLVGLSPASVFSLYGTGFSATNATEGIYSDEFGNAFNGVWWDISGTLQNGQAINTRYFENEGNTTGTSGLIFTSTAAPEPGALCLLLPFVLAVAGVRVVHRRRSAAN